jgi:hypothetical protein
MTETEPESPAASAPQSRIYEATLGAMGPVVRGAAIFKLRRNRGEGRGKTSWFAAQSWLQTEVWRETSNVRPMEP